MDETKQRIISILKEKGCELSTSEIAVNVYPDYNGLRIKQDKESKRKAAKLHRKLLHHINKLIKSNILRISKHGEKGHKFFSLNISVNEELTELSQSSGFKKRLIISKPAIPAMPIESYEQQGIIGKYESETWIDRLNSIVIMCEKIERMEKLVKITETCLRSINDCMCFNNFNSIIDRFGKKEVLEFLKKTNLEFSEYGKIANFIVSLEFLKKDNFSDILEFVSGSGTGNLIFIFSLNSEILQENFGFFREIVSAYSKNKKILNMKNNSIQKAPAFIGRAGPYCFPESDWNSRRECLCVACSQSTLIVDVEKFSSFYSFDIEKFSQLMINASKSFLSANSIQRKKSGEYFSEILDLDKPNDKEFLELSGNFIRFWNFGLSQPDINPDSVSNMISEAKKKIEEFGIAEETIYKSCGMPIKFRILMSCAFSKSGSSLSEAKYQKLAVKSIEDLYSKKMKKEILKREEISRLFTGGNDVTFHKLGDFSAEDVSREIAFIAGSYRLPFFSYNFEGLKGNMKLTSYLNLD